METNSRELIKPLTRDNRNDNLITGELLEDIEYHIKNRSSAPTIHFLMTVYGAYHRSYPEELTQALRIKYPKSHDISDQELFEKNKPVNTLSGLEGKKLFKAATSTLKILEKTVQLINQQE